ncbi:hypothetical protein FHX36_001237 [Modestobacter versicolor]|uniref:Uncharacterized protein n=1 Tax=Modestobacter versicolor TaxID=429133 RepID=A0A323V2F6_9ACTN|nr:hypothetical protein [Modestobacter versicolor]PZA18927.1 hypothetical protein DMO24_23465 [Modestobacter versicolor]
MTERPDGTQGEEPVTQAGRPPVPPAPPSDRPAPGTGGQRRTERVPFPLPPLPAQPTADDAPGAPPAAAPATGQLDLGGYPPRVPGRHRPAGDDRSVARDEDPPDDPAPDGGAHRAR